MLPLYDATELKKAHPHEITFSLHGSKHTLKASDDAERDGWYISLERAVEIGKADKESVRAGEGYKAEMEKLSMLPLLKLGKLHMLTRYRQTKHIRYGRRCCC